MANYTGRFLSVTKEGDTYTFDMGAMHFGLCDTQGSNQIKIVPISEITQLEDGLCIRVLFSNAQLYDGAPKLQINSLAAADIQRINGTAAVQYEWGNGEVLDFVYYGSNWIMINGGTPTTTHYGSRIKLSSAIDSTSTTLAATPSAVKSVYDLANGKISCTEQNVKAALHTTSGETLFLREDGSWAEVIVKPVIINVGTITISDDETSKSMTIDDERAAKITSDMTLIWYECSDLSIFQGDIDWTTFDGSVTIVCANTKPGTASLKFAFL